MEDAPRLLRIPKSECPDIWIRLPRHKWPKSWSSMEDPVVPLVRNLYGHPLAGLLWERQFEKVLLTCKTLMGKTVPRSSDGTWMGKSAELGMSVCSQKTMTMLIGICGRY